MLSKVRNSSDSGPSLCAAKHPVVVTIGDEKTAAIDVDRVLQPAQHIDITRRPMGDGEGPEIGDDAVVRSVHLIDADGVMSADIVADERDERIGLVHR